MATILWDGTEATIKGYHWTSEDQNLASALNALLDPLGPSGSDPNPDLTAARAAAEWLEAQVIDEGEPPKAPPGRVY